MKILLHGATDCGSSNYGDFLYGKLIWDHIHELFHSANIGFYNPSDFFDEFINRGNSCRFSGNIKDVTAAVYIPGGYFGEGHNATWKENLIQFMRFIPFGLKCKHFHIPLAIIGVGAGPNKNFVFRYAIKKIIRYANIVTVRDDESLNALKKIGCGGCISLTDPILAFNIKQYDKPVDTDIKRFLPVGKKIILVHYNHSKNAAVKFGEAIRIFRNDFPEYYPVVTTDQLISVQIDFRKDFEQAYGLSDYYYYEYRDPFALGGLISVSDFILTSKLHVGVTAAQKSKSVLAVAVHPEKTGRFYNQIRESDRFMALEDVSSLEIANKVESLIGKNTIVPDIAVEKAKKHLKYLDDFILSLNTNSGDAG